MCSLPFRVSFLAAILLAFALSSSLTADEVLLDRRPYGPFDAIEEGYLSSESQRLSLINSQLETVDRLRSLTVPVQWGRAYYGGDPSIAGVYTYGRGGLFGRRSAGYVVIRRAPVAVYSQPELPPAPYPPGEIYGYSPRTAARQPIGHESLQTGPNRWQYRPLYAEDMELDAEHAEVEQDQLADEDDTRTPAIEQQRTERQPADEPRIEREPAERQPAASEPEELPPPRASQERRSAVRRASNLGAARDIARDERPAIDEPRLRARSRVPPPPPEPDNGVQPPPGAEPQGPLLHNPQTGTREF